MFKYKLHLSLLVVGIASLLLVGCAEKSQENSLEDIKWTLESYGTQGNLQSLIPGTEITATFDSAEGQVRGSAGCNSYFGGYQINGDLTISMLGHTEMYCMEPEGVMDQEQEYLLILSSAGSYQIKDSKLQINCAEQKILIYTSPGE